MTTDAPAPPSRAWFLAQGLLAVALLILLPLAIRPFVYTGTVIASYPYQLDREEGFLLNQAVQLRAGETIYPDLRDYPYTVGNYTPVYPAIYAATLLFAKPGLGPGRAIVFIAVAAIAMLLAGTVYTLTCQPLPAIVAPCLFLITYDLNYWMPFARVDLPAIAFSLCGFLLFCHGERRLYMVLSALCFAIAFHTKQTQVLAPLACCAALLVDRRFRDAWLLAAVTGGVAGLVAIILVLVTGGQFWKHIVPYNNNAFSWSAVPLIFPHIWHFLKCVIIALLLVPVAIISWRRTGLARDPRRVALLIYFILAVLSIATIGKAGSDVNYLLEPDALLALIVAVAVGTILNLSRSPGNNALVWFAVAGAALFLAHAVYTVLPVIRQQIFRPVPTAEQREVADQLLLLVDSLPGDVLTEDPIYPILLKRPVLYQPFIMTQLAKEGKWDQAPLLRDITARRFSILITQQDIEPGNPAVGFTDEMRAAILENYEREGIAWLYGRFTPSPRFVHVPRKDGV